MKSLKKCAGAGGERGRKCCRRWWQEGRGGVKRGSFNLRARGGGREQCWRSAARSELRPAVCAEDCRRWRWRKLSREMYCIFVVVDDDDDDDDDDDQAWE